MRHPLGLCLALLLSISVASAQTNDSKPASSTPAAGTAAAKSGDVPKSGTAAPKKAAAAKKKPAARKAAATKQPAEKTGATRTSGKPETRTLQDIHIEGEIPVPQVLFITARDQRRFVDFQHQRYLKTSQEVGQQTALPSRLVVTGGSQADPTKETRP